MKKNIAIPLKNGYLCSHFGQCEQFIIFETENGKIISETLVTPPEHEPGLYPEWIAKKGVTTVITGGIGQNAINLFKQKKIDVFVGAPIITPKELIVDFLNNKLKEGTNYCDH